MTTKTTLRGALLATSALMISAGLAAAQDYSKYGIKEDVPGACSFASIDAKDYSGRTLNIITHAIPVIGEPTALHAQQFQELTGATVNVVHVPFGDLFQRIMIPFQTGQQAYDVLFFASLWLGDFNPYLAEVPQAYQEVSGMQSVTPTYKGVATWNGKMLNYTMDGDRHYLKYRSDVFSNPEMQALFKEKTGRDLTVPATWEEYNEVAAVFNNMDWDGDGAPNFGTAEVTKRDDLMFSAFISRVAAYAKHPDVKGGFFFDLATMEQHPRLGQGARDVRSGAGLDASGRHFLRSGRRDLLLRWRSGTDVLFVGRRLHPGDAGRQPDPQQGGRSPASGRDRGLEPHHRTVGQVRHPEHRALRDLGLVLGRRIRVGKSGHGL